jgi:hypothetical protein
MPMLRAAWIPLSLFVVLSAASSQAQEAVPLDTRRNEPVPILEEQISASAPRTIEMWLYERERERERERYENPQMGVRQKAELKGAQRQERLASLKWYGMNNSRPYVNSTPMLGGYQAPFWGSNTYDPNRWRVFMPYTVVRPGTSRY